MLKSDWITTEIPTSNIVRTEQQ
uniref:Uncharacterized protein n=1 Tax=Arundo donax TaxID=35708 RepID=A0A0A9A077_ARUDO